MPESIKVRKQPQAHCKDCSLSGLCLPFSARGLSANQFRLPMSRNEIGSYLGLAVETVSRVFTRCQANGLLEAEGKEVRILDSIRLCALAGGNMDA
jgi:CRP/FNR family transcriptional regulator